MLDHEPEENNQNAPETRDASAGAEAPSTRPAAKRVRRRAASRPAGSPDAPAPTETPAPEPVAEPAAAEPAAEAAAEAPAPAKRAARKRTAKKTAAKPAQEAPSEAAEPGPAPEPAEARAEQAEQQSAPAAGAEGEEAAKPVANAKRTRRTGVKPAKRVSHVAAAEPAPAAEPAAEEPVAVLPLAEDLAEDEAEQLVEALAQTEEQTEAEETEAAQQPPAQPAAPSPFAPAWSGNLFQAPVVPIAPFRPAAARQEAPAEEAEEAEQPSTAASRRRRRSRSRRGETATAAAPAGEEQVESADEGAEPEAEQPAERAAAQHPDALELPEESSRRRRRRRRRQTAEDLAAGGAESSDDPPNTVVKVREPRQRRSSSGGPDTVTTEDDVMGLRGSVRLVAKQQRRREGRATRSRRAPIITEAEFLARRESVERVMVVRQSAGRIQIGVLEDGVLVEHYVNRESSVSYVGNVYLGKVQNVLPSMEAAFVDINKGRNAVLYAGEVNFDAAGLSGQPRRIESALKSGQSVLVQVTKDPIGHKGARLTSQISLPGRFLVYIPGGSMMGISRKLPDTERARLKQILKKVVPEDGGVIVRTAAEGASEQELSQDVARLVAQWEEIERRAKTASAPALLSGEPDLTVRVVRDIFNEDFSKLIVSGDSAYKTVHEYLNGVAPELAERVEHWTSETDVFSVYRIEEQLAKALDRKVWLPSGGSLVIDRTEAMVVIDVNTGKFTGQGSSSLEETVTRNNLEAAEEIVRQLRLRDLGGIVVIDFIDMVLESNRELVLRRLLECLGRDRTKHQVAEVTSLGLVQMTRKRVGQGLLEAFSEPCDHCNGRGVIVHTDPVEHPGKRPEQQSGKQGKAQAAGAQAAEHERVEAVAEEAGARPQEEAGERHEETVGEGRRSRRRRKAARAAGAAEHAAEQATDEQAEAALAPVEAVTAIEVTDLEIEPVKPADRETGAAEQAEQEQRETLNLRAHAEDPDSLENAVADSGRPRRRARRAASRPAGAPSA
jgi:ribonuclease E